MTDQTWKNIVNVEALELGPCQGTEPYRWETDRPATKMGAKKLGFNFSTVPPGHSRARTTFIIQKRNCSSSSKEKHSSVSAIAFAN